MKLIFGVGGIAILMLLVFSSIGEINGDLVDCYDRYGNKLIGEKCVVSGGFNSEESARLFILMFGITVLILMFFVGSKLDAIIDEVKYDL